MKSDANAFENRLGATLKELRNMAGLTQAELASILNLSKSSIAHYECGINLPTIKILLAYANHFGTSVDYIIGKIPLETDYAILLEKANYNITYGEILKALRSLPDKKRNAFIEMLNVLSDK